MAKQNKTDMKTSQVIALLENLSIKKYVLYSGFYLGQPRVIEMKDVGEYYKLMKHLALKSDKKYVGSPCFMDTLETSYGGCVFRTHVRRGNKYNKDDSKLRAIVDRFEKENLLV